MIRGVIFDFDGTLTELTLDFVEMRRTVERMAERRLPSGAIRSLSGLYIIEMIYEVEAMLQNEGAAFRREAFSALREMEVEAAYGKEPYPYTRDVLGALRDKGIVIGVITRNCRGAVETVFPDMASYVDALVTRDDLREVKPDPRHVVAALAALALRPGEALLVGDHPTDIAAGRASGVRTVGVCAGRTPAAELEKSGADYVVGDIRAVPDIVSGPVRKPS